MNFIESILQLSPIVQGALGSALFAAALWIGQFLFSVTKNKIIYFSKKHRLDSLNTELVRHMGLLSDNDATTSLTIVGLIYLAFGFLIKALICLCIGYVFESYIPLFKEISVIFALYFLFKALDLLKDTKEGADSAKEIELIKEQISMLEGKNSPKQKT
ncbi:hypothetical protein [Vibrio genomosp. F10]|uniref:hypothetical protein n=1 Tax=Vibrio genomosp. F10 TaxID=723171 RepID=UPI00037F4C9A|nr:hypothetical protein [Vibrio genomosp. F10]OEE90466.1 hypothetical protein A1QK_18480 [Vibrio genomosp. F10 str. 9ZD137]